MSNSRTFRKNGCLRFLGVKTRLKRSLTREKHTIYGFLHVYPEKHYEALTVPDSGTSWTIWIPYKGFVHVLIWIYIVQFVDKNKLKWNRDVFSLQGKPCLKN